MERRDRSLSALKRLIYIDSLDDELRAPALSHWANKYLPEDGKELDFDLENKDLKMLLELFYKNVRFLKQFNSDLQIGMTQMRKMRTYLQNS